MKIPRHKRILSDLFIYWYAANMTNSVKKIQFIECLWIKCICGNIDKDSIFSNTNQNIYRDIPTAEKLDLHFRFIGRKSIRQSVFRRYFANSIGWLYHLSLWQIVRQLCSIWSFEFLRTHYILNSVIQPMLNAVSWNARRIARNLLKHYFIPWIRMTSDFFRTDIQACNSVF